MERASGVEIRIGVLQVEGISSTAAVQFRHTVERELARLIQTSGLTPESEVSRSLVSVDIDRSGGDHKPGSVSHARAVARAIYKGLNR